MEHRNGRVPVARMEAVGARGRRFDKVCRAGRSWRGGTEAAGVCGLIVRIVVERSVAAALGERERNDGVEGCE